MANNSTVFVPNFKIFLNGTEIALELALAVRNITVEEELNLPAMFTIQIGIVDVKTGSWQGVDLQTFKPGDEIKILMGMDHPEEMFIGEITMLDVNFGSHCEMEMRGFDRLHRLRFGTKRRSFKDMKDSDIAAKLAKEGGLTPQVEDTGTVIPYLFQNGQSNFQFLTERAKRIGFEMMVQEKNFILRKSAEGKTPNVSMVYTLDFSEFSVQLNTLAEGSEVEVRGWDLKQKKEITAKAKDGDETSIMGGQKSGYQIATAGFSSSETAIIHEMVQDASEATTLAKAKYNLALKEFIKGEGQCLGNPKIRAGQTIELKGLGDRFSGPYYVVATKHSMGEQGYTTTFKVRRTGI